MGGKQKIKHASFSVVRPWDVGCRPLWQTVKDESIDCCVRCSLIISEPTWRPGLHLPALATIGLISCNLTSAWGNLACILISHQINTTDPYKQQLPHAAVTTLCMFFITFPLTPMSCPMVNDPVQSSLNSCYSFVIAVYWHSRFWILAHVKA